MENQNNPGPTPAPTPTPVPPTPTPTPTAPTSQNPSYTNDDQHILAPDPDLSFGSIPELSKVVMTQSLPEVEVFLHINFNFQTSTMPLSPTDKERHPRRDRLRTTFNVDLKGHPLDKNITSIIVYSGYWQFFNSDGVPFPHIFGPGHYASVAEFGIPNDSISSFKSLGITPEK